MVGTWESTRSGSQGNTKDIYVTYPDGTEYKIGGSTNQQNAATYTDVGAFEIPVNQGQASVRIRTDINAAGVFRILGATQYYVEAP